MLSIEDAASAIRIEGNTVEMPLLVGPVEAVVFNGAWTAVEIRGVLFFAKNTVRAVGSGKSGGDGLQLAVLRLRANGTDGAGAALRVEDGGVVSIADNTAFVAQCDCENLATPTPTPTSATTNTTCACVPSSTSNQSNLFIKAAAVADVALSSVRVAGAGSRLSVVSSTLAFEGSAAAESAIGVRIKVRGTVDARLGGAILLENNEVRGISIANASAVAAVVAVEFSSGMLTVQNTSATFTVRGNTVQGVNVKEAKTTTASVAVTSGITVAFGGTVGLEQNTLYNVNASAARAAVLNATASPITVRSGGRISISGNTAELLTLDVNGCDMPLHNQSDHNQSDEGGQGGAP